MSLADVLEALVAVASQPDCDCAVPTDELFFICEKHELSRERALYQLGNPDTMIPLARLCAAQARALEAFEERGHHDCEDPWFSCPKHEEYCGEKPRDACYCGADTHNENVRIARAALAQGEALRERLEGGTVGDERFVYS